MPTDRTILELKMRAITYKKIERNRSEIEIETNRRNEVEINLKLKRIKDKNETNSLCN